MQDNSRAANCSAFLFAVASKIKMYMHARVFSGSPQFCFIFQGPIGIQRFMITGGDELLADHRNLDFSFQIRTDVFSVRLISLLCL